MGIATKSLPGGHSNTNFETRFLSREEIFEVLSSKRRQYILHYLDKHDGGEIELRDLVDYVAARENDTPIKELNGAQRKRVYTGLRQSHLPKLADVGIIEYEQRRGIVEPTDQAKHAHLYLEYVPEKDISWSEYYVGLSAVAATLVVVSGAGIFPFSEIPSLGLALVLVSVFAVSSIAHLYESRKNRLDADWIDVDGSSTSSN